MAAWRAVAQGGPSEQKSPITVTNVPEMNMQTR
jgi:hypothetical protein